ncbi:MAG: type II secretion system protein E [Candidatus Omnitrophica bacterium 4484_171]|nr:MAG: type II secretion system protein E [Candidatus Omnitrophica bacterium 4484_171]
MIVSGSDLLVNLGLVEPLKAKVAEEDSIIDLKERVHRRLIERMDLKKMPVEVLMLDREKFKELRQVAGKIVNNILTEETQSFISSLEIRKKLIQEIVDEALGFGPLEDLIKDNTITEIMVNNKDKIYIERDGKLELTSKRFTSNDHLRVVIERILIPLGRRIDESSPYVDARLPDGSRVNAIIPPLSLTGPTLTIRKFAKQRLTVQDLIERFDSLSEDMGKFLEASVKVRKNILVSGGTGSGKTTLLNILSEFIPDRERIITIEDSAELKLHHQHWIRLESRPPNIEGKGEVTIRELFRNTLRMRPDRIIVGECRGKEVMDMLQAMNTGHDGSLSTIHANSTRDVMIRLDSMILMSGMELPLRAIRETVASAIDLIVHTARLSDGSRKVIQITEFTGLTAGGHPDLKDIFVFKQKGVAPDGGIIGGFYPTGYIPTFYDEIISRGIILPREIFSPHT